MLQIEGGWSDSLIYSPVGPWRGPWKLAQKAPFRPPKIGQISPFWSPPEAYSVGTLEGLVPWFV